MKWVAFVWYVGKYIYWLSQCLLFELFELMSPWVGVIAGLILGNIRYSVEFWMANFIYMKLHILDKQTKHAIPYTSNNIATFV